MKPVEISKIPPCINDRVAMPRHPYRHAVPLQLRFNDIDMLGHLNNAVYVTFLDLGKSHYFSDIMSEDMDRKHVNIVVVNINCDFYAPSYFNEPLAVLTQVESISERSFTMEQRIVNVITGEVKCVGRTVMAGFDPATATGTTISDEWADAICAYEGRNLRTQGHRH